MSISDPWEPPAPPTDTEPLVTSDPRVITNHSPGVLPCPSNPPPPVGWVYWAGAVSPHAVALANKVEYTPKQFAMGSFVQAIIDGKLIAARVEWHNYQGSTGKFGCYRGTSLFRPQTPTATNQLVTAAGAKPSNFYSVTIANDPRFDSNQRIADHGLLEPITRMKAEAIVVAARAEGVELMIFETYRSQARQAALYASKATQLKKVGVHHYGLACDIVKNVHGSPSWKGDFSIVGRLAREHGLIWGGDWGRPDKPHSFVDAVHVQRCAIGRQPELFSLSWYPDDNYDPYADPLL